MESNDILIQGMDGTTRINTEHFVDLSELIYKPFKKQADGASSQDSRDYKYWVEAQKMLFKVKHQMYEDYTILDSVNPFLLILKGDDTSTEESPETQFIMSEDNVYPVTQVCTWMLIEYYNEWWDTPTAKMKCDLFDGIITYINVKHEILFKEYQSLLRDICKLAGRLSRIAWKESTHYEEAISIMTDQLYSETEFSSSSTLMIYFSELMAEMQAKEPAIEGYTKTFKIWYMTDIFIAAFQYFKEIRQAFFTTYSPRKAKNATYNNGQDMWITSEEEEDASKESSDMFKTPERSDECRETQVLFPHIKICLDSLIQWISYDFSGMFPEEATDNFNTIVLLRDKTINGERQSKWEALFTKDFWMDLFKFYFAWVDQCYYEEAHQTVQLIHLLSLVRPSFLKNQKRIEFTCMISEFCNELFQKKKGLENNQILLKFWQMLSTFYKWINIIEIPFLTKWLRSAHDFTLEILNPKVMMVPFSCIHYTLNFWENLTFKCICTKKDDVLESAKNLISIVFENYVCYLAKYQEIDGFADTVEVAEKLEPISILVKVDIGECINYILNNLESIDNMVKHNLLNFRKSLPLAQRQIHESEFWHVENIQKASWIILIAGEVLKADQKVIHRKVLESKKKADLLTDTLNDLSIAEKSKIQQISGMCWQVFSIMNRLKTIQPQIVKFKKSLVDTYITLERSFCGFFHNFWDIYLICENNFDTQSIIFLNIREMMDFK